MPLRPSQRARVRALPWAALAFSAVGLWPAGTRAGNLEPAGINLGATSFYDGFGRTEEGFTYLNYLQYAMARSINDDNAKPLYYFNDPKIDVFLFINQLVYILPEKLFDDSARLGIDFILPLVAFNTSFAPPPPSPGVQLKDNGVGFGDLTFGPMLQFKPIIADGRPVFSNRFEFDVIAPTGAYDPNKDLNQGANFASLNPYWAATVLPLPHLEVSARLHYLYNFKNYRPALGRLYSLMFPPTVKDAQAGQAGWVNFAVSYEFLQGVHVGANGYYFQQFNLDLYEEQDGSSNSGMQRYTDLGQAAVFAIGPGAFFEFGQHDKLYANVYFQPYARNRPQGNVFNLHYVHGF
jgi:hypothetical protein